MRLTTFLVPFDRRAATGLALAAALVISAGFSITAEDPPGSARTGNPLAGGPACTCLDGGQKAATPNYADLHPELNEADEIAALQSVQLALSRLADGSNFIWRRRNGHLSGLVKPTSSFRNADGAICRHFVVLLTTGLKTKKTEGIACRLANGRWQLEG